MSQGNVINLPAKRSVLIVSEEAHKQLSEYSTQTGIDMKKVASEAILDWLETVGEARLGVLTSRISQFEKKQIAKTS